MGPVWVAACFAGERPRFLAMSERAGWSVVLAPDRAQTFEDREAAQTALADFERRHSVSPFEAGAAWCVKEMTITAEFR